MLSMRILSDVICFASDVTHYGVIDVTKIESQRFQTNTAHSSYCLEKCDVC